MNVLYQLIGFGALITMGLSYWQKGKRMILLWQVVANLIFAIHYALLYALSAPTVSADVQHGKCANENLPKSEYGSLLKGCRRSINWKLTLCIYREYS